MDCVVPQSFLPFSCSEKLDKDNLPDMDLSFSDDAWFTVPDTACSNARGPSGKSSKNKDFGYDLFEFDAALDDDLDFALGPSVSSDLLADCIVPDADVLPSREVTQSSFKSLPEQQHGIQEVRNVVPKEEPVPASAPAAATFHAPRVSPAATPAYTYCVPSALTEVAPNVECYIPQSLLPVDPVSRQHALLDRREKVERFREKKKNRQFKKLIRYASRKRYAEVRPRIKGRFARKDEIAAAAAAGVPLTC